MSAKYDVSDFQKEVVEESFNVPVLIDFWAAWCQPCRLLGPVLEKVAEENTSKFKLAKVDTEKMQDIAVQYSIRGIPAVKLMVKGKVTAEFTGALPKTAVEKFLEQHLPDKNKEELEKIKGLITYGINEEIIKKLDKLISMAPKLVEAKVLLARLIVLQDSQKANNLIKDIQADSPFFLISESIRDFSNFILTDSDDFPDSTVKENLLSAKEFIKNADYENAFELLISSIINNKEYMDQQARKVSIALFSILGNEHPAVKKYRKRFDMSLY